MTSPVPVPSTRQSRAGGAAGDGADGDGGGGGGCSSAHEDSIFGGGPGSNFMQHSLFGPKHTWESESDRSKPFVACVDAPTIDEQRKNTNRENEYIMRTATTRGKCM